MLCFVLKDTGDGRGTTTPHSPNLESRHVLAPLCGPNGVNSVFLFFYVLVFLFVLLLSFYLPDVYVRRDMYSDTISVMLPFNVGYTIVLINAHGLNSPQKRRLALNDFLKLRRKLSQYKKPTLNTQLPQISTIPDTRTVF